MKRIINVCTRVEGHATVNIYIENKNDEISYVNFVIDAFRGFENFLLKKKLLDIPKLASRICGLCYASQMIVSCKAIEDIYGLNQIPEQSVLLRKLLMIGELIKSHCMNFFFQSLPDLLIIFNIRKNPLSPYDLIKFDPQLTTNIYELIKIGNDIDRIFGGRSIHPITLIPGGIAYTPSRKNITLARRYFQKAVDNLEYVIDYFIKLFSGFNPPIEFNLPNPTYLGLNKQGNYNRYDGSLGIKQDKTKIINFLKNDYSTYFDKDPNLQGINFDERENVLVGPLARNKVIENYGIDEVSTYLSYFDRSWKNNILYANFLRLIEMYIETHQGLKILDDPTLNNKETLPSLKSIKKFDGIGVVEAPRGILMHHYHLNKANTIDQVKLFIATEINIPIINQMITKYAKKLYEKLDINIVKKNIQMIIRAFDPCISCATH